MQQILLVLKAASRFEIPAETRTLPLWQRVLGHAAFGLLYALAGALILWMIPGNRIFSAFLAMAAVCALQGFLQKRPDRQVLPLLANLLTPANARGESDPLWRQAIFTLLLLLRPFCIFCILYSRQIAWLIPVAVLAAASVLSSVAVSTVSRRKLWWAAAAVTVATGVYLSKIQGGGSPCLFLSALLALFLACLLPEWGKKYLPDTAGHLLQYVCEIAVLLIGVIGASF